MSNKMYFEKTTDNEWEAKNDKGNIVATIRHDVGRCVFITYTGVMYPLSSGELATLGARLIENGHRTKSFQLDYSHVQLARDLLHKLEFSSDDELRGYIEGVRTVEDWPRKEYFD